ncbi:MAG TPA: hypothetical protein VGH37_12370 [Candidatus Acidoferrum sp.]
MMIIKSLALGLGMFFIGTIVYLILRLGAFTLPQSGQNRGTGLSVLQAYTIYNVWYWVGFAVSLAVGYLIVHRVTAGFVFQM